MKNRCLVNFSSSANFMLAYYRVTSAITVRGQISRVIWSRKKEPGNPVLLPQKPISF